MILTLLIEFGIMIVNFLLSFLQFPELNENVSSSIGNFIDLMIVNGGGVLSLFCDLDLLGYCLTVVVSVIGIEVFYSIFKFIMRVIPFVNIFHN